MKAFIFLSLLLVAMEAAHGTLTINIELNEEWELFKTQFNKRYGPLTEVTRRIIWEKNLRYIRQHNLEYDLGKHTYYLGLNAFSDLTNEEFNAKLKGKRTNRSESKGSEFMAPENMGALPSHVDWRAKGYVTPVKSQMECGACYAFSAVGSIEGQHFRKTKHLVSFSAQQIVDCAVNYGNNGCGGGYINTAFDYVKVRGVESELEYPFVNDFMECKYNESKIVTKISSYVQIKEGDESNLAAAVATVGPVSVSIFANLTSFHHYRGGIFNDPKCTSKVLDHAVLTVGYGSNYGANYWIVKNSWGSSYGVGGYVLMSKDKNNQCGIASDAYYPLL